jgi:hypothetical protein
VRPQLILTLGVADHLEDAVELAKVHLAELRDEGRPAEIPEMLRPILDRAPALIVPLRALAARWAREGRYEEAEPVLRAIVATPGVSGEVWSALERIARERGDEIRATAYLARSKIVYAVDAVREDDLAMAERHLGIAEARGAPPSDVLFVRALIHVGSGRLAEGLEALGRAAEAGFADEELLHSFRDLLDPVRANPDWDRIVLRVRANR